MPSKVTILIGAEKRDFDSAMRSVERSLKMMAERMEATAAIARYGLLALGAASGFAVRAAAEDADSILRLNTALAASGESVGRWSAKLVVASEEMQKQTVYADEEIRKLMLLAITMGAGADKAEEMARAAISLSAATAGRMGVEQAMRLAVNAGEEEYAVLGRIVPAIKNATSEAERHAIVQGLIARGWSLAQQEGQTFGGSMKKLSTALGDLGEAVGSALIPQLQAMAGWVREILPVFQKWTAEHQTATTAIVDFSLAGLGVLAFGPRLMKWAASLIGVIRGLGTSFAWARYAGILPFLGSVAAIAAAVVAAGVAIYKFNASLSAGVEASAKYSDAIRAIGAAQKAVSAAGTDEERLAALNKLMDAEQAASDAAKKQAEEYRAAWFGNYEENAKQSDRNAQKHLNDLQRFAEEADRVKARLAARPKSDDAEEEKRREEFEKAIDEATLLREQAGKTKEEQERLALAAKGFTDEQVAAIQHENRLAQAIQETADFFDSADENARDLHKSATDALREISYEIFKLRGGTDEQLKLFDLANLGTARRDIADIAAMMDQRVREEYYNAEAKLMEDAKSRAEAEKATTRERELQQEAAVRARFDTLTGTFERIQSATLARPAQDQADASARGREALQLQKDLKKLQDDANKKLTQIAASAALIANAPPGATFAP